MAGKSTERAEIEELIRLSDEARSELGHKIGKCRMAFKVPARVLGSMRTNRKSWLFGSVAAGFASSLVLRRLPRRQPGKQHGLTKKALALTLTAAKPVAKLWLSKKIKNFVSSRIADPFIADPTSANAPHGVSQTNPNPNHVRTTSSRSR